MSPSDPATQRSNLKPSNQTTERESAFMAAEYLPDHLIKTLKEDKTKVSEEPPSPGHDYEEEEVKEFVKQYFKEVAPHQFTVDGATYEWMDSQYYKKVNEIRDEGSFGADALVSNQSRNATIKTMGDQVHFATLSKDQFVSSMLKIEQRKISKTIEFLMNIPCFKSQTRKAIQRFNNCLKSLKFTRGQTVYAEGNPADCVYIVYKGEFELAKKLPKPERLSDG